MTINILLYPNLKDDKIIEQFYTQFVDSGNQNWFDYLLRYDKNKFVLTIKEDDTNKKIGDAWCFDACYENMTITRPLNDSNKNYFTHELLHSYLYVNGFYLTNKINILKDKEKVFKTVFGNVENGFLNALQHLKMFPMFCEAGFNPNQFVTDFGTDHKVNDKLIALKSRIPYELYFKNYIELYSIVIDNSNKDKKDNYLIVQEELKKMDIELFDTLENTIENWKMKSAPDFCFDNIYKTLVDRLAGIFKNNCA